MRARMVNLCLVAAAGFASAGARADERFGKLPVIQQVGVIPPQWEGGEDGRYGLDNAAQIVDRTFSKVVRESGRFKVINDAVIKGYWQSAEGRQELESQYELQSFISLSLIPKGDVVALAVRLMSPRFENYIVETETVAQSWLANASEQDIADKLETLVFRTFNRLPVDVTVTSVEGRFITVSGGAQQNLHQGDELDFYRVFITSTHPANGSWLAYDNQLLGKARIIETKTQSAVAELLALSYQGAIRVGDGAKVIGLDSRKKFQRMVEAPQFHDGKAGSPIIVPPMYPNHEKPATVPDSTTLAPAIPAAPDQRLAQAEPQGDSAVAQAAQPPAVAQATPPPAPVPATEPASTELPPTDANAAAAQPAPEQESSTRPPELLALFSNYLDQIYFSAGPRLWSTSGAASTSSKLPLWLFNNLSATGLHSIDESLKMQGKVEVGFGPTDKGSFFGMGFEGRLLYEVPFQGLIEGAERFNVGGILKFDSIAVNGEKFGGLDVFRFGMYMGLRGITSLSELKTGVDWYAEAGYLPEAVGEVGVNGSKRSVDSSGTFFLGGGGFLKGERGAPEWGGAISYNAAYFKMGRRNLGMAELNLAATARYRF